MPGVKQMLETARLAEDGDRRATQLQQIANDLAKAIPAADQVHADLQRQITLLVEAFTVLNDRVAAVAATAVRIGFGELNLTGTIGAGQTRDVKITLNPAMKDTTYSVGYGMTGGTGILGNVTILGIATKTKDSVTLTVKNGALLGITLTDTTASVVAAQLA